MMTPPVGLTDPHIFEVRADRPAFFLDRSLKFFRLLAQPLDANEQVLGLTREGR
jgi:hypothetical protein